MSRRGGPEENPLLHRDRDRDRDRQTNPADSGSDFDCDTDSDFLKNAFHHRSGLFKNARMQGAQIRRNEAYSFVRRKD